MARLLILTLLAATVPFSADAQKMRANRVPQVGIV